MGSALSFFSNVELEPVPPQYQVFINFRGGNMREGFIGFLESELKKEKVNVFVDHGELRSRVYVRLFSRIEESKIALTIFSDSYTESHWCLNELVMIKERMDQGNLEVIPVFLNVKDSDVKKLKGKFRDNFRDLMLPREEFIEKTEKWKQALKSVSQQMGFSSSNYRSHEDLVKAIVEMVKKILIDIEMREKERQESS